jgi:hypothetical protein
MTEKVVRLLHNQILDSVKTIVNFDVELFLHDDGNEVAVINTETREILFSSQWTEHRLTFVRAYSDWCDVRGVMPF